MTHDKHTHPATAVATMIHDAFMTTRLLALGQKQPEKIAYTPYNQPIRLAGMVTPVGRDIYSDNTVRKLPKDHKQKDSVTKLPFNRLY